VRAAKLQAWSATASAKPDRAHSFVFARTIAFALIQTLSSRVRDAGRVLRSAGWGSPHVAASMTWSETLLLVVRAIAFAATLSVIFAIVMHLISAS
jgi:hypothetical protein